MTGKYEVFLKPAKTWLILPRADMNPFQILALDKNFKNIKESLHALKIFKNEYPEESFQFKMAQNVYNTKISYPEVELSIKKAHMLNRSIRYQFKRLLIAYLHKKLQVVNTEDIVTLEPICKPIRIYDWHMKKIYVCEARSFLNDTLTRLLHHDEFFLQAKAPRNLLTNQDLRYNDLISIQKQLQRYGITHWIWECFAASQFDVSLLRCNYEIPIQLHILNAMFKTGEDASTRILIVDFILSEYDYHGYMSTPSESMLYLVLTHHWKNPILTFWIVECKKAWDLRLRKIADIEKHMLRIHERTRKLLPSTHEILLLWKSIVRN